MVHVGDEQEPFFLSHSPGRRALTRSSTLDLELHVSEVLALHQAPSERHARGAVR